MRSGAWAGILVIASAGVAVAQMCPEEPPGFRPHVQARPNGVTIVVPGAPLDGPVSLRRVHCTDGPGPRPLRGDVVVLSIAEGEGAGGELPVRVVGGRWRARAPSTPGRYLLTMRSREHPDLEPARFALRVFDPALALRVPIAVRVRREPSWRRATLHLDADGAFTSVALRRTRHGSLTGTARLPPGRYVPRIGNRRAAPIELSDDRAVTIAFEGSRVEVVLDGLPADAHRWALELVAADQTTRTVVLHDRGGTIDDVAPGPATVRVMRSAGGQRWQLVRELPIDVPVAGELLLEWSTSALLAGADPRRRPWRAVVGRSEPTVTSALRGLWVAIGGGLTVAVGDAAYERGDREWRRIAIPSDFARGALLSAGGPHIPEADRLRVAIAGRSWAWIEGGPYVTLRTESGLAQEWIDTYRRDAAYPCYSTDIAALGDELVVVGRCRGHAPEWDASTPHEGFIATRGPARWTVARGYPPLRAIASDGRRLVVVGDGGFVAIREGVNEWVRSRHGQADLAGVAFSASRIVARTAQGTLVEIGPRSEPRPREILSSSVGASAQPVTAHCFGSTGLVAWRAAVSFPNEGRGSESLPDRIEREGVDGWTVSATLGEPVRALLCDVARDVIVGDHTVLVTQR